MHCFIIDIGFIREAREKEDLGGHLVFSVLYIIISSLLMYCLLHFFCVLRFILFLYFFLIYILFFCSVSLLQDVASNMGKMEQKDGEAMGGEQNQRMHNRWDIWMEGNTYYALLGGGGWGER